MTFDFYDHDTAVDAPFRRVHIKPFQLVVWLRIRSDRVTAPFPTVLDTGLNHNFAITRNHLRLLGLAPEALTQLGEIRVLGEYRPLVDATVLLDDMPLQTPGGIALWPDSVPRLPLLGMRAIVSTGLIVEVDGARMQATIRRASRA